MALGIKWQKRNNKNYLQLQYKNDKITKAKQQKTIYN